MIRSKTFTTEETAISEIVSDGDDKLLLIDDATFVSAFAEAGRRHGKNLACIRCFNPARTLRALVLLLEEGNTDESAGSVGFCGECYRGLAELMFHSAALRASDS